MIRAVFFDFDGVLVDSFSFWYGLFNDALHRFQRKPMSEEEFRRLAWGISSRDNRERFFKGTSFEELVALYRKTYAGFLDRIRIMPHAKEVLASLKQQGLKIALITNSHDYMLPQILKGLGLFSYFDHIESFRQGIEPKPHPMMLNNALSRLGIGKEEAIFIGDTKVDAEAGRRAGIFTLCIGFPCDGKIDKLEDILPIVEEKGQTGP
ncbi:MAG: HAD family hydrolase [DPANN group archaeon]|nr:HAD family hydrolase [DPANN group archaeon]